MTLLIINHEVDDYPECRGRETEIIYRRKQSLPDETQKQLHDKEFYTPFKIEHTTFPYQDARQDVELSQHQTPHSTELIAICTPFNQSYVMEMLMYTRHTRQLVQHLESIMIVNYDVAGGFHTSFLEQCTQRNIQYTFLEHM